MGQWSGWWRQESWSKGRCKRCALKRWLDPLRRILGCAAHSAFWGYRRLLLLGRQLDMLHHARLLRLVVAAQPALLRPYVPLWCPAVCFRLLLLGSGTALLRVHPVLEPFVRDISHDLLCFLGAAAVLGAGIWLERQTSSGGGGAGGGSTGAAAEALAALGRALTGAGLLPNVWTLGDEEGRGYHADILFRPWRWLYAREVLAQAWAAVLQRCRPQVLRWAAGAWMKAGAPRLLALWIAQEAFSSRPAAVAQLLAVVGRN